MSAQHDRARRRVLKGLLAGGVSLPLAGLLGRAAQAQSGPPPRRAIFVYIPDGCSQPHWHPTGSETAFTLPGMTQPLEALKSDLVFLRGLNMYAGGATHEGGIRKLWTATGDVSLDVFIGQYYRQQTAHASLHLGVASTHENGGNYASFLGRDQAVTPEDNPLRAFERLFGQAATGDAVLARRRSILDASLADLDDLSTRLGATERQKLELHMDSVREVESRLTAGPSTGCSTTGWNTDGWSIPSGYNSYPAYYNRDDQFAEVGKLQMDLAVLALTCDLTRSVSIQWSHAVSPTSHAAETGVVTRHHDASHFDATIPASVNGFVALQRWYCEQFAYLVNRLKSIPDGQGTLLDSTLVFLGSELGHSGRHDHRDMPFVLAGRAGGLATGRFLDYRSANNGDGESHAKLLVSIARAMGIPLNSFGYVGHGEGPLPRL